MHQLSDQRIDLAVLLNQGVSPLPSGMKEASRRVVHEAVHGIGAVDFIEQQIAYPRRAIGKGKKPDDPASP